MAQQEDPAYLHGLDMQFDCCNDSKSRRIATGALPFRPYQVPAMGEYHDTTEQTENDAILL